MALGDLVTTSALDIAPILSLAVAQPASGVGSVSVTVPEGKIWRPISMFHQLSTSATAANRVDTIKVADNSGNMLFQIAAPGNAQAANNLLQYSYITNIAYNNNANGVVVTPLPNILLPAGFSISIFVSAVQVGDQISGIMFGYNELG